MARRPEEIAPPQTYYDDDAAVKYAYNSRMVKIQREMADRAIEVLCLKADEPAYILDLGCGSGLSGEALSDAGYEWIGCDISASMLEVAKQRDCEGDLFHSDLGTGLYFREGIFDGAISISTLQWLTNCEKWQTPKKRLANLFNTLFKCLKRGARAVFQLYPTNSLQLEMISECAMKAGFVFSMLIDFPNSSKAKKYYIILDAGSTRRPIPKALEIELPSSNNNNDDNNNNNNNNNNSNIPGVAETWKERKEKKLIKENKQIIMQQGINQVEEQALRSHHLHAPIKKKRKQKRGVERFMDKDWIIKQKERRMAKGYDVPKTSKYTGRKRKPIF